MVGEEVACAARSRLAEVDRKRPNERAAGKWGRWRCTGGTRVRHRLRGRAMWLGDPRGAVELAEGNPGCDGGRAKGLLWPTHWTLACITSNVGC